MDQAWTLIFLMLVEAFRWIEYFHIENEIGLQEIDFDLGFHP